jgi:ferredoxin
VRSLPPGALELGPVLVEGQRAGAIILKDEETCIRCGLCAARCPAGTITMQSFVTKEEYRV